MIAISDLPGFDSSHQWMVDDAEAIALLAAPCLADLDPADDVAKLKAVRAILRGALLRWLEVGNGGFTQRTETVGPFSESESVDNRRRSIFWPSEITSLQGICSSTSNAGTAGVIGTATVLHAPTCALVFGALYCSCGADIAGFPLWETAE